MTEKLQQLEIRVEDAEKKALEAEKRAAELEKEKSALINNMPYIATGGVKGESDERRVLRVFGASHVRDLLNVNVCSPEFKHVSENVKAEVITLKRQLDIARQIQQLCYGEALDHDTDDGKASRVRGILDNAYAKGYDIAGRLKAFGTGNTGEGLEWVDTVISSQYIPEYELDHKVIGAFRSMNMPSQSYSLRVKTGLGVARIIGEGAQMSAGTFGTSTIDMKAVKLAEYYEIPEEVQEDTIGDFLALARMEVVEAQIRAYDTWALNGDTTATHMDSDVAALGADDARKAGKGLRKLAIENSNTIDLDTLNAGVLSDTQIVAARAAMGKYGVNPAELMWIVSPVGNQRFQGLAQVTTQDVFGANATIQKGVLDRYRGIPLYVSEFVRDDLNASGVHDGVTTDRTVVHLVNHRRFFQGRRRPIRTMITRDLPYYDRWLLASYSRTDFKGHDQSTEPSSILITGVK